MQVFNYCYRCPLHADLLADVRGINCPWGCRLAHEERPPFFVDPLHVRPIRLLGDPVLRQVAQPVATIDASVEQLVTELFATMRSSGGIGLAAPQIGISLRVAVVEVDGVSWTLINPEITSRSTETTVAEEGCLSIPGRWGRVERANAIGVKTLLLQEPFRASGLAARAVQHELDHLNGVLFIDRGPITRFDIQ